MLGNTKSRLLDSVSFPTHDFTSQIGRGSCLASRTNQHLSCQSLGWPGTKLDKPSDCSLGLLLIQYLLNSKKYQQILRLQCCLHKMMDWWKFSELNAVSILINPGPVTFSLHLVLSSFLPSPSLLGATNDESMEEAKFLALITFLRIEINNPNIHSDPWLKCDRDCIRNSCDFLQSLRLAGCKCLPPQLRDFTCP